MLPTSSSGQHLEDGRVGAGHRIPVIFRRITKWKQMDFELAAWQLTYLCLAPKRVYRNVYFHKQTSNHWARDDPAVLVLTSACLAVSAVAWAVVYQLTLLQTLKVAVLMIIRDFFLTGLVISTALWFFSNRVLVSAPSHSTPADATVEWGYAFDVHTNSFFPLYIALYLFQLFLLPIVLKSNWVCLWVGNTIYLAAAGSYCYGIFLGFQALPFVIRSEILLAPLLPIAMLYTLSLLGFPVAKHVLALYFGP